MRQKLEVATTFKNLNLVENRCGYYIEALRSDKGKKVHFEIVLHVL